MRRAKYSPGPRSPGLESTTVGTRTTGSTSADVGLHRHPEERERRPGAQAAPHVCEEPRAELRVVALLGRPLAQTSVEELGSTPALPDLTKPRTPLLVAQGPRIVVASRSLRRRVEQDQARDAFGMRRRKERRQARALLRSPQDRTLGAEIVHHRAQVVHARFERRNLAHPVGQSRAPFIDHDHARELRQTLDEANEERLFPDRQDVACEAANEHEICRSVAHDLVRDRHIATARVEDVGCVHDVNAIRRRRNERRASSRGSGAPGLRR